MAENLEDLGFSVTLLQRGTHVMPTLDYDMACDVHAYLRSCGIDLKLGFDVVGFEPDDAADEVRVLGEGGESIPASLVVTAIQQ